MWVGLLLGTVLPKQEQGHIQPVADGENLANSHLIRQKFKVKKPCIYTDPFQTHTTVKLNL